jgi:hypothetical protein
MFSKIMHANDGSEPAFHALSLALGIARQNHSELHMVCVEEIDYMPEFIERCENRPGRRLGDFTKLYNAPAVWPRKVMYHCKLISWPDIRSGT